MDGVSDVMRLRFAADDLKAHYLEAASAAGGRPSSQQLSDWLWKSTKLGEMLLGVHAKLSNIQIESFKPSVDGLSYRRATAEAKEPKPYRPGESSLGGS